MPDVKPVVKVHYCAMKELLVVRKTTADLVCYAELDYHSVPDLVMHIQYKGKIGGIR